MHRSSNCKNTNPSTPHRKALELCRLLDLKLKADISATIRTVICLDIAATQCAAPFDAEEALKRTKCRPNEYLRQRRTVEKLLGMAKQITVPELCVQLDLPARVQQQAARMFDVYRERAQIDDQSDFTHPQYAAMSVYQCCKAMHVKASRATLLRHSHLRGAQWTMLEKDWTKCMGTSEQLLAAMKQAEARQAAEADKRSAAADIADRQNADDALPSRVNQKREVVESYENWRDRMLKEAYAKLAAMETSEVTA